MKLGRLVFLIAGLCGPASADSLADMRQDLAGLLYETKRLRLELTATQMGGLATDGALLDRTAAIENELQRLTGQTEELAYRISAIVRDATQRIALLEARICTMEPGCEVTQLGATLPLGSDTDSGLDLVLPGEILTISEQAEFDAANDMLLSGDTRSAAQMFEEFVKAFPIGPLTQRAHLLLGHAYMDSAEFRLAARAYLEAYSLDEANEVAPTALYHLALSFHRMGNAQEGCLTLSEVQFRYAQTEVAADAKLAEAELSCP
jgi:tol-pal system protein YbgF